SRGAEGCEALLARLQEPQLEAVAGRARLVQGNLEIAPLALVFRSGEGWDVAQPWIDGYDGGPAPAKRSLAQPRSGPEAWLDDLGSRLGKLLIAGLARVDGRGSDSWRELFANAEKLGSVLFHARLERLVGELEARRHQARPDPRPAGVAVLELAAVLEMGRELLR
ncbi:MAG: hypothetical protein GY856_24510, partial [bacterium]|nr:hypothetical protein [bacterium]